MFAWNQTAARASPRAHHGARPTAICFAAKAAAHRYPSNSYPAHRSKGHVTPPDGTAHPPSAATSSARLMLPRCCSTWAIRHGRDLRY